MMNLIFLLDVMDKEPSLITVWITALLLALGGLVLSRYKWWLSTIVVAIAALLAFAEIWELRDPFVGPQIIREAGNSYVVQTYVAAVLSIFLPLVGLMVKWRKSK